MAGSEAVKLRMKIGDHEFEAEGPREVVSAQLETWKQLARLNADVVPETGLGTPPQHVFAVHEKEQLVSLRVNLYGQRRNADAALLLLYGYSTRFANGNAEVSARRLKAALAASGHRPKRVDRAVAPYIEAGLVDKVGSHKSAAYVLTASGHVHAAALALRLAKSIH